MLRPMATQVGGEGNPQLVRFAFDRKFYYRRHLQEENLLRQIYQYLYKISIRYRTKINNENIIQSNLSLINSNNEFNLTSLNLDKNETMALVGESGSGKSVTAMSILQLLPELKTTYPENSSIVFDGIDILNA